ncbi:hypothetical protein E2553_24655 [Paraburkholderia dipogonis]|uniref:Uncharacterized protein n=1 Tax=Paraburkholderia dipogonis TaxID=1211383 RepID=A0A4Y8MR34_9BURK|nr:SIR2 family protein [Paraburkholderia dipogonis]TFE39986.1 hypothetical protein E2553_24655 [Paraburkholderia dipogonis]
MSNQESDFAGTIPFAQMDPSEFETFVIRLLGLHLDLQGKELVAQSTDMYDCVAPHGFDHFSGPVLIEICTSLSKARFSKITQRFGAFAYKAEVAGAQSRPALLIITHSRQEENKKFRDLIHSYGGKVDQSHVEIWSIEKLDALVKQHPGAIAIADDLLRIRFKNAKDQAGSWQEKRLEHIASLSERYSSGQFSLFLGAGVSASAGMPDWNLLLNTLFLTYLSKETRANDVAAKERTVKLVERMNDINKHSALVTARYLRKGISGTGKDQHAFTRAVRAALYGLRNKDKPAASELIKILARLCMPRRSGAPVRSVVTYNFDDLFEQQLKATAIPYKCVYTQEADVDVDELPVLHVHGFIPEFDGHAGSEDKSLVFAEEGYHQIYTDAYHWSNLVQLSALRDSTCLMVGLSMADPNLRRLLEIAKRGVEKHRHYAFMKRVDVEEFAVSKTKDGERVQLFENREEVSNFLEENHALTEVLMQELGVTVIWYESHDEIPRFLHSVGGFPESPQAL